MTISSDTQKIICYKAFEAYSKGEPLRPREKKRRKKTGPRDVPNGSGALQNPF